MLESLIQRAIDNRWIILGLTLILVGCGLFAAVHLPVDAYPDISPQKAWIVTTYPGRAAEEVEQQITIPIEIAMRTLPRVLDMRSDTIFGLSAIYVVFEDGVDTYWARQQVFERLNQVELPDGAGMPELVPDTSACGEIYRYELVSDGTVAVMELRTLNEWVVMPALLRTPGIAGVYNFGGLEKRYSVIFHPAQLLRLNISLEDVIEALVKNNVSGGGGILPRGSMELVIRGTGVIENIEQIKDVFVKSVDGTPIFVSDIASVEIDFTPPWSMYSKDQTDEGVQGVVQMRRGEDPSTVLHDLKKFVAELNEDLPDGVQIEAFYDRQDLVDATIGTVSHSVSIGITLVLLVLLLFLGRPLMALLVAFTIPFSMLFAFCLMYLTDIPIGLLSIGAIDFGIIVEGTLITADAIARRLGASGTKKPKEVLEVIRTTVLDMYKPIFVSMSLIMMAFLPLLTLTRIEGLLFRPLALTIIFALLGALIFSLFIAPVLAYFFYRWGYRDWDNPLLKLATPLYVAYIKLIMKARYLVATIAVAGLVVLLCELVPRLGVEFLPYMDEGGIWIRSQFPEGMSLQQTHECGRHIRQFLREEFPDVEYISAQVGRADDSEPYTASRMELMIGLKPHSQWKHFKTKHEIIAAIRNRLHEEYPTTAFSFSQPILDQVIDDTNGTSAQLAVEISGPDLDVLLELAIQTRTLLESIRGAADTAIDQPGPQAQLKIEPDRRLCARYNVEIEDVVQVINVAMGGEPIGVLYEGERRFDIAARFDRAAMASPQAIGRLPVFNVDGIPVPLMQVTNISVVDGQTTISRTDGRRRLTYEVMSVVVMKVVLLPRRNGVLHRKSKYRRAIVSSGSVCLRTSNAPIIISCSSYQ